MSSKGVTPVRGELVWKVGGQQGEGIDSTGVVFLNACHKLGYYTFGYRHFMSRIKGGHTNYQVRVSTRPVHAVGDTTDVLVAFDQESIDENGREVAEGGVVVADGFGAHLPAGVASGVQLVEVPLTKIAADLGSSLMKNMVAMGATSALTGLPTEPFEGYVRKTFSRKGEDVVQANLEALKAGYAYVAERWGEQAQLRLAPPPPRHGHRLVIEGDYAAAVGALAAGCRFLSAYPITPASMIMEWLAKQFPKVGGVVVQAEDEIAAICMAIGANYAGARAMTSTSGPGFSLMQEALGLAGLTETPVVIVDVQRAGPATGLPTKHEQGDLNEMVYGSHGEFPRIVIAPGTIEECFYDLAEAFNLADRHQCPVIVAMDLTLGMSRGTVEGFDWNRVQIDRGAIVSADELQRLDRYERFADTPSGISPRALPGTPGGIHLTTGDEHRFDGRITEDPGIRAAIMDKRLRKVAQVSFPGIAIRGSLPADLLLVGLGATTGALWEAAERLEAEGVRAAVAQIRRVWPFPADELREALARAEATLVVESNATAQLAHLIRSQMGGELLPGLLKYDGNPIRPGEVVARAKEVLAHVYGARIA
jgi:2-oxoglutarate ferredoxin oxidoreductase subunit alpha